MKNVAFLRTSDYDSSQARMRITPDWITWAWGVQNKDVEKFLGIYSYAEWVKVDVDGKYVYAVNYPAADRVICSGVRKEDDDIQLVDFSAEHCVEITKIGYCDDYGDIPGEYDDVESPFAAIISPFPLKPSALYYFYDEEKLNPGIINEEWIKEVVMKEEHHVELYYDIPHDVWSPEVQQERMRKEIKKELSEMQKKRKAI